LDGGLNATAIQHLAFNFRGRESFRAHHIDRQLIVRFFAKMLNCTNEDSTTNEEMLFRRRFRPSIRLTGLHILGGRRVKLLLVLLGTKIVSLVLVRGR
jgi:hypothetical protein